MQDVVHGAGIEPCIHEPGPHYRASAAGVLLDLALRLPYLVGGVAMVAGFAVQEQGVHQASLRHWGTCYDHLLAAEAYRLEHRSARFRRSIPAQAIPPCPSLLWQAKPRGFSADTARSVPHLVRTTLLGVRFAPQFDYSPP